MNWLDRIAITTPHMILCGSEEEYLAVMKHLKCKYFDRWITNSYGATTHTLEKKGGMVCVVCLDFTEGKQNTLGEMLGILVHEATHIWQHMLQDMGESKPSSEFEAYSVQCIAQRLIEDFLERGKWKKSKN